MKKTVFIAMSIMISLVLLAGCGAKENNNAVKDDSEQTTAETPVSIVNDNNSYFFIIDGEKFSAGDKIADVSKVGYSLKSDELTEEIPANTYMIGAGGMMNSEEKAIFDLTPFNTKDSSIKASDAVIAGFELRYVSAKHDERSANFEVYGGLKLGSTEEEVKDIFGEPSSVNEIESVAGEPTSKYCTYASDDVYRSYEFVFEEGKVSGIEWKNLVFAEEN